MRNEYLLINFVVNLIIKKSSWNVSTLYKKLSQGYVYKDVSLIIGEDCFYLNFRKIKLHAL